MARATVQPDPSGPARPRRNAKNTKSGQGRSFCPKTRLARCEDAALPADLADIAALQGALQAHETALSLAHEHRVHRAHLSPALLEVLDRGAALDAVQVEALRARAARWRSDVDTLFDFMTPTLKSNVEAGKLKFLGVMQDKPTPLMPSIAPAASQGVPKEALMSGWYGVAVRAGTPPEIVAKLHESINAALKNQAVIDKLFDLGEVKGSAAPADFQKFYLEELKRWSTFIKAAGIKAQL